jgi:hypothetical protein
LGNLFTGGTHLQHPKLLAQLSYYLMGGRGTQRKPSKLSEEFLGRVERDLGSQSGPSLLDIPLLPALRKLKGIIQGIKTPLALDTVEVRSLQADFAYQSLNGPWYQSPGRQEPATLGTGYSLLVKGLVVVLLHQGFRDCGGEFLASGEDCPGQGVQAGRLLRHYFLHAIQPEIETFM